MPKKPDKLTLRAYDVGFGDCFLLSFHYGEDARHVLIDFGSTRKPKGKRGAGNYMERIAKRIQADCDGSLTAVVATHRHKDHISGFSMKGGKGNGAIIRSLKPELVIQPWTEDPKAAKDALAPTKKLRGAAARKALQVRSLHDMQQYAGYVKSAASSLKGTRLRATREQLEFLGDDNDLTNRAAVENLMTMGKKPARYVYYGAKSGLDTLLPGVKTQVLGPPTLKQTETIKRQRSKDQDEFWHMRSGFWARRGALASHTTDLTRPLFPRHLHKGLPPWDARWYTFHAQNEHADSMLSIVRTLDRSMNNTSLILLFQIGDICLLFPGDAQYENWMYALSQAGIPELLSKVNVYKVGHHGSLNATPKTLWKGFKHKGKATKRKRLLSVLSTKDDVHGSAGKKTEVPRSTLVNELKRNSDLIDTREAKASELALVHTIKIR